MAGRRGESEGINLISSTYSDDDDEMEEDIQHQEHPPIDDAAHDHDTTAYNPPITTTTPNDDDDTKSNRSNDTPRLSNETGSRPLTPQQQQQLSLPSPPQAVPVAESSRSRMGRLTIVDYGHDEAALSPEAEEGEITGAGIVKIGSQLQMTNVDIQEKTLSGTMQMASTQAVAAQICELDASDSHLINSAGNESESVEEAVTVSVEVAEDVDPLDKFLPPPPVGKCSDELQRRMNKFLLLKKERGISYNAEVRNKKEYRNPDFLLHAVTYQEIDQIGSCFSKDVFDPHGYDKIDYYDEIEADMKREMERKEQEKKKNQKVDFISVGAQPGVGGPSPKINIPLAGLSTGAAGGLHSVTAAVDSVTRDGRQNKKSKWDKVDGDRRNVPPPGGHDPVSVTGAHAALLNAANAGAGYTAFAQQRRREAEEKRSSERKVDRRS